MTSFKIKTFFAGLLARLLVCFFNTLTYGNSGDVFSCDSNLR